MRFSAILFLVISSSLLFARGPKYTKPDVTVPENWQAPPPWQQAAPKDSIPKGAWWKLFNDPELDQYEDRAMANSQTLKASVARLAEARSFASITASDLYPHLSGGASAQRERLSGNRPLLGGTTAQLHPVTQSDFQIPFDLNYEVDLFGRVRNAVAAANASYQASSADLENVRLSVSAELAGDFFQLRELDAEMEVVRKAIDFEQKGMNLVQNRHTGGAASGLDVAQQQTVLDSTIAQLALLQQQRDQFQHAIAALQGLPASSFIAPVRALAVEPPAVPLMMPSELLERRPDIAEAERNVAAQNARIGVARAAFYPNIPLVGSGGFESRAISTLISAPSAFWSIGLQAIEPILNGGRNRATLENVRATYDENVANARYSGGLVTYLDVITAQEQLLTSQRLATQILGQRLTTDVLLVKALGGGWDSASLSAIGIKPSLKQAVQQ